MIMGTFGGHDYLVTRRSFTIASLIRKEGEAGVVKYLKGACRDIDSINVQCLYSTPFCIYTGTLGQAN